MLQILGLNWEKHLLRIIILQCHWQYHKVCVHVPWKLIDFKLMTNHWIIHGPCIHAAYAWIIQIVFNPLSPKHFILDWLWRLLSIKNSFAKKINVVLLKSVGTSIKCINNINGENKKMQVNTLKLTFLTSSLSNK